MRIKRRNLVWLGILAALTGIAVISQGLGATSSLILLGALGVAAGISLFNMEPRSFIKSVQSKATFGNKVSADAREASERARARGGYFVNNMQLVDVGLIALHENFDGMVMQRTRSLSLDENGVRPYLSLQVPAIEADRRASIRFEIDDGTGKKVYVHEQDVYLRDGKIDILADMQMPLSGSTLNLSPGESDLRVYVDDELVGILGFTLVPSTRDRWAGRRQQRANQRLADTPPKDDDTPMTLEELLRQQSRRSK